MLWLEAMLSYYMISCLLNTLYLSDDIAIEWIALQTYKIVYKGAKSWCNQYLYLEHSVHCRHHVYPYMPAICNVIIDCLNDKSIVAAY